MRVRMLKTATGSPDGILVLEFKQGEVFDLPESLALPWLSRGIAEEEKSIHRIPETKEEAKYTGRKKR